MSDGLVDGRCAWGSSAPEYVERGITTLVLTPIAPPEALPDLIDGLAP